MTYVTCSVCLEGIDVVAFVKGTSYCRNCLKKIIREEKILEGISAD